MSYRQESAAARAFQVELLRAAIWLVILIAAASYAGWLGAGIVIVVCTILEVERRLEKRLDNQQGEIRETREALEELGAQIEELGAQIHQSQEDEESNWEADRGIQIAQRQRAKARGMGKGSEREAERNTAGQAQRDVERALRERLRRDILQNLVQPQTTERLIEVLHIGRDRVEEICSELVADRLVVRVLSSLGYWWPITRRRSLWALTDAGLAQSKSNQSPPPV